MENIWNELPPFKICRSQRNPDFHHTHTHTHTHTHIYIYIYKVSRIMCLASKMYYSNLQNLWIYSVLWQRGIKFGGRIKFTTQLTLKQADYPGLSRRLQFNWVITHSFPLSRLTLRPHGLQCTRLLCPWDFSDKKPGVGCHVILQGIFSTQGLNPWLLHWQADC